MVWKPSFDGFIYLVKRLQNMFFPMLKNAIFRCVSRTHGPQTPRQRCKSRPCTVSIACVNGHGRKTA